MRRRWYVPYVYMGPAILLFGAFALYPLLRSAQFSLYEWDGLGPSTFVGFANYADLLADPTLRAAFAHALVLIGFFALLPLAAGLALAGILVRGRACGLPAFRTVVFLPQVVAMVVVAVAWRHIYAPNGPLNTLLRAVGLGGWAKTWLGDYTWTLPAVGLVGTWVQLGLVTVLLMAGMSKIPPEIYQAARLDGAGPIREFFAITLPQVRGEIAVALTLTIVAALKTFDLVYVTTGGGPGTSTTVPAYEVYMRTFRQGAVGSGAAIAVTLAAIIFAINLLVNRVIDRREP